MDQSKRGDIHRPVRKHHQSKLIKTSFRLEKPFFDELKERLDNERTRWNSEFIKGLVKGGLLSKAALTESREMYTASQLPTVEHLSQIVETAFWASLQREENRALSFSIGYEQPSSDLSGDFAFKTPVPFDTKNLTKLSPAIGPNSGILVSPNKNNSLEIRAVSTESPTPLRIQVLDPGQLIISFMEANIALVSGAEAVHIRAPVLTRSSQIWSKFALEDESDSPFSNPRLDVLLKTLRRMRALGNGGALIVVPDDEEWKESVYQPIIYSGHDKFGHGATVITWFKDAQKESGTYSDPTNIVRGQLDDVARIFSRMTAVDGATLITRDLNVIGFGVKLKAAPDPAEPPVIYKIDPLHNEGRITSVELSSLGGMRHQSAARFVHNQTNSIAFVVSQDGNVTAFVIKEREKGVALYAYARLELTLF